MSVKLSKQFWGRHSGQDIYVLRMENKSGAYVEITNYGAAITKIVVPDEKLNLENVVIGFPELQGYLDDTCYVGSTIGRYANRISGASFTLDGERFELTRNDGGNCNHGGFSGFNAKVFEIEGAGAEVVLTLESPDGEGGFPGCLKLKVTYSWDESNTLRINYQACADRSTVANFTNHTYFNLSSFKNSIATHNLKIPSGRILQLLQDHTPSGNMTGTGEMKFDSNTVETKFTRTGDRVNGINLYYILDQVNPKKELVHAATLVDTKSKRRLSVYTDYEGLFLYTGDYLTSEHHAHTGRKLKPFDGLCLECHHYPDSINHPDFPQAVLRPGQVYHQNIVFSFGLIHHHE